MLKSHLIYLEGEQMRRIICALAVGLFLLSSVFSQEDWSQVYSLLDRIEDSLTELQSSNEQMQTSNEDMQSIIDNSQMSVIRLKIIIGEQEKLLAQWQNNWQQTQEILKKQELLLDSYEKRLKFWRIATPILAALSIGTTIAIMSSVR